MHKDFRRILACFLCMTMLASINDNVYAESRYTDASDDEVIFNEIETETDDRSETSEKIADETEQSEMISEDTDTEESVTDTISETDDTEDEESICEETLSETVEDIDLETEDENEYEISEVETEEVTTVDVELKIDEIRKIQNDKLERDGFHAAGYIDSDMEAEALGMSSCVLYSADAEGLPSRYSALESGVLTSVKNQGAWGSCWAFSAVTAAENDYKGIYGKEADLSETHLINFLYNSAVNGPDGGLEGDEVIPLRQPKVNNGGNAMYTTFALARWTGVADEAKDTSLVYPDAESTKGSTELNIPQELAYADALHMQNAYWIHAGETEVIKQQIMENGAVGASYMHDESCSSNYVDKSIYDGPTVYYNYQKYGTSHAISIVGWDDDFDKNKFAYTAINRDPTIIEAGISFVPKSNGAWLIKNSWGTEYGDDGYFWMSYEDASLSDTMYAFDFEKADNYDHIYQYDGAVGTRYESGDEITAAAIYKSNGNQMLEAVGVGIASVETDYVVEIYTKLSDPNDPQSGQLVSSVEGHTTFQGYHTVKLDESVLLAEGDTFSVVITLSNGKVNGQSGAAIFMDQSYDNGSAVRFVAKTNPGETFLRKANQWTDVYESGTCRIKAYTSNYEFDIPQEDIALTPQMVQEIGEQEFDGIKNEPDMMISYMGNRLVKNVDYSVEYRNNDHAADRTDEYAPKAIVTGMGKYTGTVEQTFTILPRTITEEMVETTALMYNGNVQNDLKIVNGTTQLVKGTDYTISFSKQPCSVGTYQATITGKGNYTGTLQLSVAVEKTTLTEAMLTVDGTVEYTGKAIKPQIKVCVYDVNLPSGSYTISYKNNTNVGTATVTVTGKGGCQGKVQKTFEILPKDVSQNTAVTVAKTVYTGKKLTPSVTVKCDGRTLKKGKDYIVTYEDNVMAGENAVLTITGNGNYTGAFQQNFVILPKEVASGSIQAEIGYREGGSVVRVLYGKTELSETERDIAVYQAGTRTMVDVTQLVPGEKYDIEVILKGNYKVNNATSAVKRNVSCKKYVGDLRVELQNNTETIIFNGKAQKPKLSVRDQNGSEVAKSKYTVSYADNINAGTAKAIVTGKGEYAGTKTIEFTIQKQSLDNLTIQPVKDQTYVQKAICPVVKVMNGNKTLKCGEGKDYVCTYADNVDVAYENGRVIAGAYVDVQLSDNYAIPEGTALRVYFKILPAKLSSLTLSKAYYTKQAVLPDKIVVKAGKLEVPTDCYEVTGANNVNVSGGAVLNVTAVPQSNYTGSLSKKYTIVKQELKTLVLPEIPDMPYLGKPVDVSDYTIKRQDGEDIDRGQYDLTIKNNTKPGKATVTYKAKSDGLYRGSVSIKFNIVKATMRQAIDYEAATAIEKPYTGSEITLTDEELRQLAPIKGHTGAGNPPYTVTYAKNTDAGKAAVKLTGKDYLQGSATVYFTITPKSVSSLTISTGEKQLSYNDGAPVYLELREVKDGEQVLKAGKDYTYSYTNADKKGTACLTVTGVGNYTGTRYIYYRIS